MYRRLMAMRFASIPFMNECIYMIFMKILVSDISDLGNFRKVSFGNQYEVNGNFEFL